MSNCTETRPGISRLQDRHTSHTSHISHTSHTSHCTLAAYFSPHNSSLSAKLLFVDLHIFSAIYFFLLSSPLPFPPLLTCPFLSNSICILRGIFFQYESSAIGIPTDYVPVEQREMLARGGTPQPRSSLHLGLCLGYVRTVFAPKNLCNVALSASQGLMCEKNKLQLRRLSPDLFHRCRLVQTSSRLLSYRNPLLISPAAVGQQTLDLSRLTLPPRC